MVKAVQDVGRDSELEAQRAGHQMACMEIWGGSSHVDDGISVPGIDAHVMSRPFEGDAEGGDIHYVSTCGVGNISRFIVADVAGHGSAVSSLSRELRRLMRKHINTLDQTRFVRALNEQFLQLANQGVFATALAATYFAPTHQLLTCNAGHPRPLWRRASEGRWSALDYDSPEVSSSPGDGNLPIGIIEPTEYAQFAIELAPGDSVLIYSDSLIEARDEAGHQIGEKGLLELAAKLDADEPQRFLSDLLGSLQERAGASSLGDDVTALLLRHTGHEPPRQSVGERLRVMAKMIGIAPV